MPIVNENDTTATTEIKYGDNDRLASRVAQIISADCLILLSDVDGLYTDNPKTNKKAKLIKTVKEIDESIKKYANRTENFYGSGGMKTKIEAAKICQLAGCYMAIANGNYINPIKKMTQNQRCTWFIPKVSKLDARKQWIIGSIAPKGEVIKLPRGATPVDFAYAVHTKIGDTTISCEINGKESPLQSILSNGDEVKIITSKNVSPSLHWLTSSKTGKARAAIRRHWQYRENFIWW